MSNDFIAKTCFFKCVRKVSKKVKSLARALERYWFEAINTISSKAWLNISTALYLATKMSHLNIPAHRWVSSRGEKVLYIFHMLHVNSSARQWWETQIACINQSENNISVCINTPISTFYGHLIWWVCASSTLYCISLVPLWSKTCNCELQTKLQLFRRFF